jgi:hypothetical protein
MKAVTDYFINLNSITKMVSEPSNSKLQQNKSQLKSNDQSGEEILRFGFWDLFVIWDF